MFYKTLYLVLLLFLLCGLQNVSAQEVDLRATETVYTFTGEGPHDQFGVSVSAAGDVNGSGYSDILIGARFHPSTETSAEAYGRAYIYFGGPDMDTSPNIIIDGESQNDWFGQSVAIIPDVNGDGIDDILIGAPFNDRGGDSAGAAYLFFGSTTFQEPPFPKYLSAQDADVIFTGEEADDHFGNAIAGLGDFTGNGYNDIAISARFSNREGSNRGAVYVYSGGESLSTAPGIIITGEQNDSWFGEAIAGAGDVNQDGLSDLIIGAPFYRKSLIELEAGRAYLFSGDSERSGVVSATTADYIFTAESGFDRFGSSLAGAGDLNGSGYPDIVIGAPTNAAGGTDSGRAYIYFGGPVISSAPGIVLTGETTNARFGSSVGSAGRFNSLSFCDLIVGSIFHNQNGFGAGKAQIFSGGAPMDTFSDAYILGENPDDNLGISVASTENITGPDINGILVGAYFWAPQGSGLAYGRVYLVIRHLTTDVNQWQLFE